MQSTPSAKRRVVAMLGGNAFSAPDTELTMDGQFRFARRALEALMPLIKPDTEVLLGHGNGPQVGHMLARVEAAAEEAYPLPLDVCVAESQGELGYVLQQTLYNLLRERDIARSVATVMTQVVVAPDDPAFAHPDKPIGRFYDRARAEQLSAQGLEMREDAGRGWRRVVPSPRPLEVVEAEVVDQLLTAGVVVIAAGGGGVPVIRREQRLHGVEAVIDKDRVAALLADRVGAELLIILTGVPYAYRDFGTPTQRPIERISAHEVRALLEQGCFAAGSMAPKMEAAASFADRPGRRALVCDPSSLQGAMEGQDGTIVYCSGEPELS
ncbi:MAG: carbamate kinase [Haliangiales bacterium]